MKAIRKLRNVYALLFAACLCLTVWLGVAYSLEATLAFGAISAISLLFLVRQSRLLSVATLIWENRILAVPSALISAEGSPRLVDVEKTAVSTFGILIGSRIYRWGLDGMHGVRLNAVQIDKEQMYLTFGDGAQTMGVELLHGMTQKQAVLAATQKLWHETGVRAEISDW
jgi:hypothetical protein